METIYVLDNSTRITYFIKGIKTILPQTKSRLTEYPVPEGGFISDHTYADPNILDMSIICDGLDSTKQSYSVDSSGNVSYLTYTALKELLCNWQRDGTQLDIQTMHRLFKSMVLQGVSWTESSNSWTKFEPTLSFKEVRIARTYITDLNALSSSYYADYSQEVSSGEENGVEDDSDLGESVIDSAKGGAAIGAVIGGFVGGGVPGAIVGAAVGGLVGAAVGFFSWVFGG